MNRMKLVSRSAAAIGIAASLATVSGVACANPLTYGSTTFDSYNAAIDQTTGFAWVSPNIASGKIYGNLQTLCPGGACTGPLAGLTWANDTQVNQFWKDIGIPLNTVLGVPEPSCCQTQSYSAFGNTNRLGDLIDFLGPTDSTGNGLGYTHYLGGITNNSLTVGLPNTSYMFHYYSSTIFGHTPAFDNESAFTYGTGNGTAQDPSTGGWFYFTQQTGNPTSVPEPGSLGMLGFGLGLLGLGFAWDQRRRRNRMDRTDGMPMDERVLA